jgi:SAM-dependent methyltransferase
MIADHEAEAPPIRSFRDPAGILFRDGDRILRRVNPAAAGTLNTFLKTRTAREATESGKLVTSTRLAEDLYEHERIPFPSYPYEWPAEMLRAAGGLTIELAQSALEEGFGLKDASPYNVLFRGSRPVFVDVLSFEQRDPLQSAWMPYAQFVRTFLLPLIASRYFGLHPHQTLAGQRDGLEPETLYRWAGPMRRLTPPFLNLVTLPQWLGKKRDDSIYQPKAEASAEKATFILEGLLRSCEGQLSGALAGSAADSTWSNYLDHKSLYTAGQLAQKEAFVAEALALARPTTVLDVGANEGHFSFLAAEQGASVVAIDSDPVVVGSIWRRASEKGLDVLPMVVDLTRPTPAMGWRNQECASFLDRARGGFDLVLMLAVVHHILVTERIPLEDLVNLIAEISRDYVLIEFVGPEDPMFQRIVRGRDHLYSHLTRARFEAAAGERFELVRSRRIDGLERWLYLFRRRRASDCKTC